MNFRLHLHCSCPHFQIVHQPCRQYRLARQ
ncbi:MAG: SWIM zinc finger family protein [Bacteroidales bacterium]